MMLKMLYLKISLHTIDIIKTIDFVYLSQIVTTIHRTVKYNQTCFSDHLY